MMAGVLLFGAVTYFLHRQPGFTPRPMAPFYGTLMPAFMVASAVGILIFRKRLKDIQDPAKRAEQMLVAYAFGEGAALFGGVYYFMSDDPRWYLIGLFVLLGGFILLPIRHR